jgi:hypothetical protein
MSRGRQALVSYTFAKSSDLGSTDTGNPAGTTNVRRPTKIESCRRIYHGMKDQGYLRFLLLELLFRLASDVSDEMFAIDTEQPLAPLVPLRLRPHVNTALHG